MSAKEGRRTGFAAVAGVALGLAILGLVAATGGALVLARWPWMPGLLRWVGVAYFLWLAYDAWPKGTQGDAPLALVGAVAAFRRGVIVNLLNAKSAIFFLTVLPGFVHPGAWPRSQLMVLAGSYLAIATAVHVSVVALAAPASRLMSDPASSRWIGRAFALILLGLAAMMALRA